MRFELTEARGILTLTPGVIRALLIGIPESWASANYGPGTWSPREIVAHLIYGEMADWIPRMRIILAHGASHPFDPFDRAGHETFIGTRSLGSLVDEFARQRAESLAELDAARFTDADLDRTGTHPALGPVTLRNLLATWVVHDLNHIAQLSKALAYQYKDQVGVWEKYLSILTPPNPR
ncbi:MAG TPA: DinB family protein [Polyangiaceae bacterium]